jgi:hypothetical protein
MNTEMYDTLSYSKQIKIKKTIINIPNNVYIKQKYNEYDYIRNNINEIIIINKDDFMINDNYYQNNYNKCVREDDFNNLYNIYDLKENFFNPDKHSPPNSWKSRLMERIENQTKII